jgi:hypothetical protein
MGSSAEGAKGYEELERSHGRDLYWSCAVFIDLKKRFSKLKNSNSLKRTGMRLK